MFHKEKDSKISLGPFRILCSSVNVISLFNCMWIYLCRVIYFLTLLVLHNSQTPLRFKMFFSIWQKKKKRKKEKGNNAKTTETTMFLAVQSLSLVLLFVTPWTTACQAPLSSIISQSLLKFMSIKSVMLSNHLMLCRPLLLLPFQSFPASRSFPTSQLFASGGQNIGTSA